MRTRLAELRGSCSVFETGPCPQSHRIRFGYRYSKLQPWRRFGKLDLLFRGLAEGHMKGGTGVAPDPNLRDPRCHHGRRGRISGCHGRSSLAPFHRGAIGNAGSRPESSAPLAADSWQSRALRRLRRAALDRQRTCPQWHEPQAIRSTTRLRKISQLRSHGRVAGREEFGLFHTLQS